MNKSACTVLHNAVLSDNIPTYTGGTNITIKCPCAGAGLLHGPMQARTCQALCQLLALQQPQFPCCNDVDTCLADDAKGCVGHCARLLRRAMQRIQMHPGLTLHPRQQQLRASAYLCSEGRAHELAVAWLPGCAAPREALPLLLATVLVAVPAIRPTLLVAVPAMLAAFVGVQQVGHYLHSCALQLIFVCIW